MSVYIMLYNTPFLLVALAKVFALPTMRKLAKLSSSLWRQLQLLSATGVAFLALCSNSKGHARRAHTLHIFKRVGKAKEVKLFSQLQLLIYILCHLDAFFINKYPLNFPATKSRAYSVANTLRSTMTITTFRPTKQHRNALGQEVEKDTRQTCGASIERNA